MEPLSNNNQNIESLDLTTKYLMENIDKTLIIFCNPISGNKEGKIILNIANHYLTKEKYKLIDFQYLVTQKQYEPIKSVFFELINKEDNLKGQLLLKNLTERCKINKESGLPDNFQKIRTLIAGGDGTVLSMIDSFPKNGIDINYCYFGHIPLGTGNDLANSLGFSNHVNISEYNLDELYIILNKYYKAQFGKIDVWKIDLQLDQIDGEILANTKNGKIPLKDDNGNIIKRYIRTFINYISLGYDARVGYNFDPKRASSRNLNKCIYFLEGLKKLCCQKTNSIQAFIDTFTVYDSPDNSIDEESFFSDNNTDNNDNNYYKDKENVTTSKIITGGNINNFEHSQNILNYDNKKNNHHHEKFKCMSLKTFKVNQNNNHKCLVLSGKPCSIIFQNIVNYMSGVRDIWGKGEEKLSVGIKNGNNDEIIKYTQKLNHMADCKQRFDDKMLEIFTFDNGLETGLENVIGGLAKKIYHGRGPMEIKFLETPKYIKEDRKHRIYFNIDGEYFHIVKPLLLRIELNRDYSGGQLPFLVGNTQI